MTCSDWGDLAVGICELENGGARQERLCTPDMKRQTFKALMRSSSASVDFNPIKLDSNAPKMNLPFHRKAFSLEENLPSLRSKEIYGSPRGAAKIAKTADSEPRNPKKFFRPDMFSAKRIARTWKSWGSASEGLGSNQETEKGKERELESSSFSTGKHMLKGILKKKKKKSSKVANSFTLEEEEQPVKQRKVRFLIPEGQGPGETSRTNGLIMQENEGKTFLHQAKKDNEKSLNVSLSPLSGVSWFIRCFSGLNLKIRDEKKKKREKEWERNRDLWKNGFPLLPVVTSQGPNANQWNMEDPFLEKDTKPVAGPSSDDEDSLYEPIIMESPPPQILNPREKLASFHERMEPVGCKPVNFSKPVRPTVAPEYIKSSQKYTEHSLVPENETASTSHQVSLMVCTCNHNGTGLVFVDADPSACSIQNGVKCRNSSTKINSDADTLCASLDRNTDNLSAGGVMTLYSLDSSTMTDDPTVCGGCSLPHRMATSNEALPAAVAPPYMKVCVTSQIVSEFPQNIIDADVQPCQTCMDSWLFRVNPSNQVTLKSTLIPDRSASGSSITVDEYAQSEPYQPSRTYSEGDLEEKPLELANHDVIHVSPSVNLDGKDCESSVFPPRGSKAVKPRARTRITLGGTSDWQKLVESSKSMEPDTKFENINFAAMKNEDVMDTASFDLKPVAGRRSSVPVAIEAKGAMSDQNKDCSANSSKASSFMISPSFKPINPFSTNSFNLRKSKYRSRTPSCEDI